MKLSLDIISDTNETLFSAQGTGFLQFDMLNTPFRLGDRFVITSSDKITELEILLDTSLGVSRVLLTDGHLEFPIPFDKRRRAYPPAAFGGNRLWGYIRALDPRERRNYRNLSLNTYDLPGQTSVFPHASTNSGTADERFMARNAIDGVTQTRLHGEWPYASRSRVTAGHARSLLRRPAPHKPSASEAAPSAGYVSKTFIRVSLESSQPSHRSKYGAEACDRLKRPFAGGRGGPSPILSCSSNETTPYRPQARYPP